MALASKYYFLTPDKKELNKAKIQSHQIALYYEHMKNGIKLDVEQKYLKLKANTALIKNKQKTAQAANTILQQYKEMYRSGLINIAILLLKQAEAQKADAELIKAKFDQTVSAAELKIAIGSPIKPDIDSIKLIYKEER
jgi:outer membrane protein TolC